VSKISTPFQPRLASGRPKVILPSALAEIAAGRDHIRTAEFSRAVSKADQTVRKLHCLKGECFGIRPIKIGRDLLWPVAAIAALLNGELPSSARRRDGRPQATGTARVRRTAGRLGTKAL
jgi:hypothetical protein